MVSPELESACNFTVGWVVDKFNAGDGFSCVLLVIDESGRNATVYSRDSIDEAVDLAHAELTSCAQDVQAYVIAYGGGWRDASGSEELAVIVEAEDHSPSTPLRLAFGLQRAESQRLELTGEVLEFEPPEWALFAAPG